MTEKKVRQRGTALRSIKSAPRSREGPLPCAALAATYVALGRRETCYLNLTWRRVRAASAAPSVRRSLSMSNLSSEPKNDAALARGARWLSLSRCASGLCLSALGVSSLTGCLSPREEGAVSETPSFVPPLAAPPTPGPITPPPVPVTGGGEMGPPVTSLETPAPVAE